MEKRAIEDAKVKMAQTEQDAERARLAEEKRLLEKIEIGGGKCLFIISEKKVEKIPEMKKSFDDRLF